MLLLLDFFAPVPAQAVENNYSAKYREIRKKSLFKNLEICMVMENYKFSEEFVKGGDRSETRQG